jgi:hypothetical protein
MSAKVARAVVIVTPPFLPASLQAARVFRLLRLLPLLRAAERFMRGREAEEQRAELHERLEEISLRLAALERGLGRDDAPEP